MPSSKSYRNELSLIDTSSIGRRTTSTICKDTKKKLTKNEKTHRKIRKINPLTPNDPYSGRTALLTSKVTFYIFIQQI